MTARITVYLHSLYTAVFLFRCIHFFILNEAKWPLDVVLAQEICTAKCFALWLFQRNLIALRCATLFNIFFPFQRIITS